MHDEEFQGHQYMNCFRRDMVKVLMALPSSSKSRIAKAENQFHFCVSNFSHNQKYKTKRLFNYLIFNKYLL